MRQIFMSTIDLKEPIMAIERTLSIVKPDAVAKTHIGEIFARFEKRVLKL